jgi:hypothetical protein
VTLTLDSGQATLAARANATLVPIVIVETFSNKLTNTVGATYYWTRGGPLRYSWNGGAAVYFDPRLQRITPVDRGFEHLPNATIYSTREVIEIVVDGTPRAGTYLWPELIALNLIGARVTVGSLLLDPETETAELPYWDLSALGTVHAVRWRGEITTVSEFDDDTQTITITAESREFILSQFARLLYGESPRDSDVGRVLPQLVGTVREVVGLWATGGTYCRINAAITNTATSAVFSAQFGDFKGWTRSPATVGLIRGWCLIGNELVFYQHASTAGDGTHTVTLTRSSFYAAPTAHDAGEIVYEIPWILEVAVSGLPVFSLGEIFSLEAEADAPIDLRLLGRNGVDLQYVDQVGMSLIQVDCQRTFALAGEGAGGWGGFFGGNPSTKIVSDVEGAVTLGTATTRVTMSGDSSNWSARTTSSTSIPSTPTIAPVTGGVEFAWGATDQNGDRFAYRDLGSLSIGSVEWRVEVELTQAQVDEIVFLELGTNRKLYSPAGYYLAEEKVVYPASRLVAGSNILRLITHVDPITNLVVRMFFKNAVSTNHKLRIIGVIETRPITQLANHPSDVVGLIVDDLIGSTDLGVDATSAAQTVTDVPSVSINADLAALGGTLGEVLAQIGFNARINYLLAEGATQTLIKAKSATTSYAFPAVSRAIGAVFSGMRVTPRNIAEIANRFSALYDGRAGADFGEANAYRQTLIADEMRNDISTKVATASITANQTKFGIRESDVIPLGLLADSTSAIDVLGYYAAESLRGQVSRYSAVIPWWLGYDLEPGDIVSIQPRWETGAIKCRVLRVVFDFDRNGVGVNLEAVT